MIALHQIPDELVPSDPRLGATCVPVPQERIDALTRSGSAVLGLHPGHAHADGFAASVHAELHGLLGVPATHRIQLVPGRPELPGARDLSRRTSPLSDDISWHGVTYFCPSWLFGVPPGYTVVITDVDLGLREGITTTDLLLLAHAARSVAERDPGQIENDLAHKAELVREWATGKPWITDVRRDGDDLVTVLATTLAARRIAELGEFFEANHLAYGITSPADPQSLHIGLYDTVSVADLVKLLGLLDHVVEVTS